MKVTPDAPVLTFGDPPPTIDEALERLAGRRALAIELAAHTRTVVAGTVQNRHVRRNNLRVALNEQRKREANRAINGAFALSVTAKTEAQALAKARAFVRRDTAIVTKPGDPGGYFGEYDCSDCCSMSHCETHHKDEGTYPFVVTDASLDVRARANAQDVENAAAWEARRLALEVL